VNIEQAKAVAGRRIAETRRRIETDLPAFLAEIAERHNNATQDRYDSWEFRNDPLTVRVAKALCAAGFHDWAVARDGVSVYNALSERRYWMQLAEAAIREIGHDQGTIL